MKSLVREGFTRQQWKGGVHSEQDGIANPGIAVPAVARALMKLGGSVNQSCAARGIETTGGAVSGVVTEHGTIRTPLAIQAGGAWVSSFCRQLGIRFPQASIRQTILSVWTGNLELPEAFVSNAVSVTRRGANLHTLAIGGWGRLDPTGHLLRFPTQFLPMLSRRWRSLSVGNLEGLCGGHETLARWRFDAPTPMEARRILDPAHDPKSIKLTLKRAADLIPALAATPVAATWAGYIDSTPDGVPVIDEMEDVPGLILAAGFSGHGFGIGPGAAHLVADIATGQSPIVDPKPFRLSRFNRGGRTDVSEF